jgi:MFS family permease
MDIERKDTSRRPGLRDVMGMPDVRWLLLAQGCSDFGDSLTLVTLLLLINKLVGNSAALAMMVVVVGIPQLTIGLVAGALVDRLSRRTVMIVADVLRAVLVLGFTLVSSPSQLWILYALGAAQASIGTFFTPARGALVAQVVPGSLLLAANSASQLLRVLVMSFGTLVAGALVSSLNAYWPAFALDAVTFLVSATLVSFVVESSAPAAGRKAGPSLVRSFVTGAAYVARSPTLLGMLAVVVAVMLGASSANMLLVPFLINGLHVSAVWLGTLSAGQTVGMLASGATLALFASRVAPCALVAGSAVILGIAMAFIAAVSQAWQLVPILLVVGFAGLPLQASVATMVQTSVPNELLGRVGAAVMSLVGAANIVAVALSGAIADVVGVREFFLVAGVTAMFAGACGMVFMRPRRNAARDGVSRQSKDGGVAYER